MTGYDLRSRDGSSDVCSSDLWRRPQFRPHRLSRRKYLRDVPAPDGCGRHDQPPAARRPHGFRPLARRHFDRTVAGGLPRGGRTLGVDAQYGNMVMAVEIAQLPVLSDNYIYLVHDPESRRTAVVDPAVGPPVLAEAARRGWQITDIWNTHWHPDHTGANLEIKEATGASITDRKRSEERRVGEECVRTRRSRWSRYP